MYKKLLVPLDASLFAEQALPLAGTIAGACHADLELVLVHESFPFALHDAAIVSDAIRVRQNDYLESLARTLSQGFGIHVGSIVLDEPVVDAICNHARKTHADLIVMTTHGRTGLSRAWLGSVADAVTRHGRIPVLTQRPRDVAVEGKETIVSSDLFDRVLIPLDGSPAAEAILNDAVEIGRCGKARYTLLRIVRPVPLVVMDYSLPQAYPIMPLDVEATNLLTLEAGAYLSSVADSLKRRGVVVGTRVEMAEHPARAILDVARAKQVDLVAMTTHGRGASRLIVGSVADKVLRGSTCAMLVDRPAAVASAAAEAVELTEGAVLSPA